MTKPDFDAFADVIRRVLKQPDLALARISRATEVPGWNSLSHVMLILEIQNEFDVDIEPGETLMLENLGALYNLTVARMQE